MTPVPTRIASRISDGIKKFQTIIESAKSRDVNESDTVVLLTDIFSNILGFDKYADLTTELSIRSAFCDLALKIDGKICLLIEAKAVGVELKENHVKQAVDYAANKGIDWVILTNSVSWKVYKILFSKPIQNILVIEFDFLKLNPKNSDDIETVYNLTKEAISKSSLDDCYSQKQATNRFMIGNFITTEPILNALRKELRQLYPDIKVTTDEIKTVLTNEVIKREIFEGEESEDAKRKISRAYKKKERAKNGKAENSTVAHVTESSVEANVSTENIETSTAPPSSN
jgi:predicted type IV restriction endonuclease